MCTPCRHRGDEWGVYRRSEYDSRGESDFRPYFTRPQKRSMPRCLDMVQRNMWENAMMDTQHRTLLVVPPFEAAAPPSDMAMTAWARSRAMFWAGVHSGMKSSRMKRSTVRIVCSEGELPVPSSIS